jgi:hypothetical protein
VVRGVPAQPLLQAAAAAHHLDAGLAIKKPNKKKPKKTHLIKPTKNVFFWFFKIFNFL